MSWPILWFLPRALLSARGPRVSADARPSLHPRLPRGGADDQPGHDGAAGAERCVRMRLEQSIKARGAPSSCVKHRRHCERSEAIQGCVRDSGLLRFARNDAERVCPTHGCHRPRRRTIQYSRGSYGRLRGGGVLDTPLSRGMTAGDGAAALAPSARELGLRQKNEDQRPQAPQYVTPSDPYSALRGRFIPGKSTVEGTSATLHQWFCRTIFVSSQRVWQC